MENKKYDELYKSWLKHKSFFNKTDMKPNNCISTEHNPPTMIVHLPGRNVHRCPNCGQETVFYVSGITC